MIIVGDLHLKETEPFFTHQREFLKWLEDNFAYEEMVILGDVFDTSSPQWKVYSLFKSFLLSREAKTYIVQGNHDFSRRKGSAVVSFNMLHHINVYIDKTEFTSEEGWNCLAIPYKYNMEEYKDIKFSGDFCFTHTMPEEEAFGGEFVDLSHLDAFLVYGHIHERREEYTNKKIVGVPVITRKGEVNNPIYRINENKEFEEVPTEVDFQYKTIEFGEDIDNPNYIYEIHNAPDVNSIFQEYKDAYIRVAGCTYKQGSIDSEKEELNVHSLSEEFKYFCEQELVEEDIKSKGITYLKEVGASA